MLSRTHLFGVGDLLGVGVLLGVGDLSVLDFLSLLAGEGFSEYSSASLSSVSRVPRESVIRSPSSSLSCATLSLMKAAMTPTFGLSRQSYCQIFVFYKEWSLQSSLLSQRRSLSIT